MREGGRGGLLESQFCCAFFKVLVRERLLCRQSLNWIILEQSAKQVEAKGVRAADLAVPLLEDVGVGLDGLHMYKFGKSIDVLPAVLWVKVSRDTWRRGWERACRGTQNLDNALHLILLKGDILLVVHLCLLSLEDGSQRQQFREYASNCPQVCFV